MTDLPELTLRLGAIAKLEKLGVGNRAAVYALDAGRVLKLYHAGSEGFCSREADALEAAAAAGIAAPQLLAALHDEAGAGLVLARHEGPLLIDRLRARPWTSVAAGRALARLHGSVHDIPAPAGLWTMHEKIADRIERTADSLPPGVPDRLLAELARLPGGDRLCHGDFQAAHVVLGAASPVILDWSDAASADPVADVALTLFITRQGAQPPRYHIVNAAAAVPRRILAGSYLRTYRSLRPIDEEKLSRWRAVVALAWRGIASRSDQRKILRLAETLPRN